MIPCLINYELQRKLYFIRPSCCIPRSEKINLKNTSGRSKVQNIAFFEFFKLNTATLKWATFLCTRTLENVDQYA